MDAVGFLRLGGLFVSFMSGNGTKAVVQAVAGDPAHAGRLAAVVIGFAFAAFLGELVGLAAGKGRVPAVLATEALLLALAWWWRAQPTTLTGLLVAAMGWQNATLHKAGHLTVGLTYVTGTLVRLGATGAHACIGRGGWRDTGAYATLFAALVLGGLGGALAHRLSWGVSLAVPAAAACVLAAACVRGVAAAA